MNNKRYFALNEYLKDKYGERVLKICIDGGFSCPNRDGTCGKGGCIYCSEKGSGEHIKFSNISQQVRNHLLSYRGERANKFIAYFQNFTNTYDTVENLKKKYDSALIDERIVVLSVATRPDCIDEEKAELLASYLKKYDVWVELGLQTSNEETAKLINRGYTNHIFTEAVEILNRHGIKVVAHMMLGLPGETEKDVLNTVEFLNKHKLFGIKIHSTYVVRHTKLEKMFLNGEYTPLDLEEYICLACKVLKRIDSDFVIHKISGDAPKDLLVAPEWNSHKKWIINGITKFLEENNIVQGDEKE